MVTTDWEGFSAFKEGDAESTAHVVYLRERQSQYTPSTPVNFLSWVRDSKESFQRVVQSRMFIFDQLKKYKKLHFYNDFNNFRTEMDQDEKKQWQDIFAQVSSEEAICSVCSSGEADAADNRIILCDGGCVPGMTRFLQHHRIDASFQTLTLI